MELAASLLCLEERAPFNFTIKSERTPTLHVQFEQTFDILNFNYIPLCIHKLNFEDKCNGHIGQL